MDPRRGVGPIAASAQTKNESAVEVAGLMLKEMAGLKSNPPDSAELDARKANLTGGFGRTIATSGGLAGYLSGLALQGIDLNEINRYAPGKLTPPMDSADYPNHLIWMHHAEGSLASRVIADYRVWMTAPPKTRSRLVDSEDEVQFAEDYLGKHPWFGGAEFTAADIMMVFPLNFGMALNVVDKTKFPNINAWKAKIEARPAYQRMLAKARPDGMVGALPALPAHAPSGPRTPAPAAN